MDYAVVFERSRNDSRVSHGPSLEGKRFQVAAMGEQGEASEETVFEYHQDGDLVWATYRVALSASASSWERVTATLSTFGTAR